MLPAVFYLVVVTPLRETTFGEIFAARGWVPYVISYFSIWSGVLLVWKYRRLRAQSRVIDRFERKMTVYRQPVDANDETVVGEGDVYRTETLRRIEPLAGRRAVLRRRMTATAADMLSAPYFRAWRSLDWLGEESWEDAARKEVANAYQILLPPDIYQLPDEHANASQAKAIMPAIFFSYYRYNQ